MIEWRERLATSCHCCWSLASPRLVNTILERTAAFPQLFELADQVLCWIIREVGLSSCGLSLRTDSPLIESDQRSSIRVWSQIWSSPPCTMIQWFIHSLNSRPSTVFPWFNRSNRWWMMNQRHVAQLRGKQRDLQWFTTTIWEGFGARTGSEHQWQVQVMILMR